MRDHNSDGAGVIRSSPSAERNCGPICDVLRQVLPERGNILEVASGSGQHVVHFAERLTALAWQPTDPSPAMRASIAARLEAADLPNVAAPLALDVCDSWPQQEFAGVVAINLCHISPWEATEGLVRGAAATLAPGGRFFVYGPFRRDRAHTSKGNRAFDARLRAEDPAWGIRDVEAVVELALDQGFQFGEVYKMPANNLSLAFFAPA